MRSPALCDPVAAVAPLDLLTTFEVEAMKNVLFVALLLVGLCGISSAVQHAAGTGSGINSNAFQNGQPIPLDWWKNETLDRQREQWEAEHGPLE